MCDFQTKLHLFYFYLLHKVLLPPRGLWLNQLQMNLTRDKAGLDFNLRADLRQACIDPRVDAP